MLRSGNEVYRRQKWSSCYSTWWSRDWSCIPVTPNRAICPGHILEAGNRIDLITIRSFDRSTTARIPAPQHDPVDVFAPKVAVWIYEGPPQWALRGLLNLVHPAHPNAPVSSYPAPLSLHIPRAEQRSMTIRLPAPHRAQYRAARIGAAITGNR